jgi:hypothetical protein
MNIKCQNDGANIRNNFKSQIKNKKKLPDKAFFLNFRLISYIFLVNNKKILKYTLTKIANLTKYTLRAKYYKDVECSAHNPIRVASLAQEVSEAMSMLSPTWVQSSGPLPS